jgi:hypothetical protein
MIRMRYDYARQLLTKGYAGGNRVFSRHDNILVIQDDRDYFYGIELDVAEDFKYIENGYVTFTVAHPVIDKNTRFTL